MGQGESLALKRVPPTNFDFGKHWDTKIKPLLSHPKVKFAIHKCFPDYSPLKPPVLHSADTTPYLLLQDKKKKQVLDSLREKKLLPEEYLLLEQNTYDESDEEFDIWDGTNLPTSKSRIYWAKLMEIETTISGVYDDWQNKMESYVITDAKELSKWNSTFMLILAQLAIPEEKWILDTNPDTQAITVISESLYNAFDLTTWATEDNKLEKYVLNRGIITT